MSSCKASRTELSLKLFTTLSRAGDSLHARAFADNPLDGALSESEFAVLEALLHRGPMNQCEVSEKILRSRGSISVVVQNLVTKGLVDRVADPADRRRNDISLTPEGRKLIGEIFPRVAESITRACEKLAPDEIEEYIRLNKKLGKEG